MAIDLDVREAPSGLSTLVDDTPKTGPAGTGTGGTGTGGTGPGTTGPGTAADAAGSTIPRGRCTVDRTSVHRAALCEVFLTDANRVDEETFDVSAQLPRSHTYYTDHPTRTSSVDSLLLLECCRQAETLIAHRFLGVETQTHFILRAWDLVLPGVNRLGPAIDPHLLRIVVRLEDPRRLGGVLRSARYRMQLFAAGPSGPGAIGGSGGPAGPGDESDEIPIGELWMEVSYAPTSAYRALRTTVRGGEYPSTSADLGSSPVPPALDSSWFARTRTENVLLSQIALTDEGFRGLLRLPFSNTSMFDHPQDHVPAMVLTDAARQLALFGLAEVAGLSVAHTVVTALHGEFRRYVELDRAAELHLALLELPTREPGGAGLRSAVLVEVRQGGEIPAVMRLELSTLPGTTAAAGGRW